MSVSSRCVVTTNSPDYNVRAIRGRPNNRLAIKIHVASRFVNLSGRDLATNFGSHFVKESGAFLLDRYSLPAMSHVWSVEHRFDTWLAVELAVCEGWHLLGPIPAGAMP